MAEKSELQRRFKCEQKNYELLKLRCFPRMLAIREIINSRCMDNVREKSKFMVVQYDFLRRMLDFYNCHTNYTIEGLDEIADCIRHDEYIRRNVKEYESLLNEVDCAHHRIYVILRELDYPYAREYMDELASEIPI